MSPHLTALAQARLAARPSRSAGSDLAPRSLPIAAHGTTITFQGVGLPNKLFKY